MQPYGAGSYEILLNTIPLDLVDAKELTFELEWDVVITAILNKKTVKDRFIIWNGKIKNDPEGVAIFVADKQNQNLISGELSTGGKTYSILSSQANRYYIVETKSIETNDAIPINRSELNAFAQVTTKSSDKFIDFMMVYTDDVLAQNASVESLIEARVESMNQSLEDSCVNFRYRLVHTESVTYTETGTMLIDLGCIYAGADGCLDSLHTLRDTHGADLVQMMIYNNDACGIAYSGGIDQYFDNRAYSVVALLCDHKTMSHEFGHNIGLQHDRYTEDLGPRETSSTYGIGYGFVDLFNKKRDIMVYNDQCSDLGFSCTRLAKFSSPNISNSGVAFGTAGFSDNASLLNDAYAYIANYRTANTSYDPKISNSCGASADAPDIHCFIATAALGSYMHDDVLFLRNFRDTVLKGTRFGDSFIKTYYKYSPYIAKMVSENLYIKKGVRSIIKLGVFTIKNIKDILLLTVLILFFAMFGLFGRDERSKLVLLLSLFLLPNFYSEAGVAISPLYYDEVGQSAAAKNKLPPNVYANISAAQLSESSSSSSQTNTTTGISSNANLGFHSEGFYISIVPHSSGNYSTTEKADGSSKVRYFCWSRLYVRSY